MSHIVLGDGREWDEELSPDMRAYYVAEGAVVTDDAAPVTFPRTFENGEWVEPDPPAEPNGDVPPPDGGDGSSQPLEAPVVDEPADPVQTPAEPVDVPVEQEVAATEGSISDAPADAVADEPVDEAVSKAKRAR